MRIRMTTATMKPAKSSGLTASMADGPCGLVESRPSKDSLVGRCTALFVARPAGATPADVTSGLVPRVHGRGRAPDPTMDPRNKCERDSREAGRAREESGASPPSLRAGSRRGEKGDEVGALLTVFHAGVAHAGARHGGEGVGEEAVEA